MSLPAKFEGPEKKLEIVLFEPLPQMRHNRDGRWHKVIEPCKAEILSSVSDRYMDAYLISESSLFVWSDRILIITCGQTTLLNAVPEILKFVAPENIAFVFYERKSFMFPNDQPSDFEEDVSFLVQFFPGRSYRLGPANADHVHVFYSACGCVQSASDATLQVLMHDIGPAAVQACMPPADGVGKDPGHELGLRALFKDMYIDSHIFAPVGYSLNGIDSKNYVTIHVTPNPGSSYVSFETNIAEASGMELAEKVVSIFRPQRFSLVLTDSGTADPLSLAPSLTQLHPGYRAVDKTLYAFEYGYAMRFINYVAAEADDTFHGHPATAQPNAYHHG